ncbi:MAG: MFS transporter [Planctomycetaceae bacterium]|nr:MFS transporter [Planctomycetaceae bacterium]
MDWNSYVRVSALMFLEFAVWGAWMPVLALRLLGPLKLNGKQTGWIYATFPLASIFSPLVAGYLADKCVNAEWVIMGAHIAGAVLMFIAAKQTKFWGMFWTMLLYSVFYTATIPLVAKVLYANQSVAKIDTWVWVWAPVSWAVIGYFLTGMRQLRKIGGDGPDSLYLAAILSVAMALVCLVQPATPHQAAAATAGAQIVANPMVAAFGMLSNSNYLLFMLLQLVVSGMMQFYFLGTGQFMQDRGVSGKNVSAAMGMAQVVQAAATILLLEPLIGLAPKLGFAQYEGYRWTFATGALCWTVLFATYLLSRRSLGVILIQSFHGFAYVFFIIAGQKFVGLVAPGEIQGSALSLLAIATNGIGLFVGTQLAGFAMQKNSVGGKFQWSKIWSVPLVITLAGALLFAVAFKAPAPSAFQPAKPHAQKAVATEHGHR